MSCPLRLDSHVDTLHELARLNSHDFCLNKDRRDLCVDIPKLTKGGVNVCFFALFIKEEWGIDNGRKRIEILFSILDNLLKENRRLSLSNSLREMIEDIDSKISISLGIENGCILNENIELLKNYFSLGIRYLTLCHNFSNQICDSSTDRPIHNGLSNFGKLLIKEMNKIGMMIDISHASDKSVEDVLEISELPIIASHSNSYTIHKNPRNLNDKLLERIAANNGVVQVSLLPKCVGKNGNVSDFVDHIDYLIKLIGVNHVGIGSDFDGGGGIIGCSNMGEMGNITEELRKRNFHKNEIDKVWGKNFFRVYLNNFS